MIEYSILLALRLDPLRYLFDRPVLTGRIMREFGIKYVTKKSAKGNFVVDHLAFLPVSDDKAIDVDFPDE